MMILAVKLKPSELTQVPEKPLQPCSGCGVLLQAQDPNRLGYLPDRDMKVAYSINITVMLYI